MSQLYSITRDSETDLIVDDRNACGGASGKGFWSYNGPCDYLIFGKRSQIEGYFSKSGLEEHATTIGADPLQLLKFRAI